MVLALTLATISLCVVAIHHASAMNLSDAAGAAALTYGAHRAMRARLARYVRSVIRSFVVLGIR
jgi:threonine/homoserine/homoserine lactone efflux protein